MVVIVIVGVLSAAAIPQFLGLKDRAVAGSMIGSMSGFAKECATGQITGIPAPIDGTKIGNAGITTNLSAGTTVDNVTTGAVACDGKTAVTFQNTDDFTAGKINKMVCGKSATDGSNQEASATSKVCTITVAADGQISGAWS